VNHHYAATAAGTRPGRPSPHRRIARRAGIAAAAAALGVVAGCGAGGVVVVTVTPSAPEASTLVSGTGGGAGSPTTASTAVTVRDGAASSTASTPARTTVSRSAEPSPVHVSTFEGDDETYGVGMAVMALFSVAPTDATAFEQAATVTVNGQRADGAWFWQDSTVPGYASEALYREKDYWPAHSTIDVNLPVQGLSAGDGLVYDDSLTLTFKVGAAHISHVDNAQHRMTVTSDDKVVQSFPISLGEADTPTYDGVKVVMAKGSVKPGIHTRLPNGTVEMKSDPGESPSYDIMVPWSVRITNSGEFVHAASWNGRNIGSLNTSHGCTNLNPDDAEWFYQFSRLGDVVEYPDANPAGTVQPAWDGWGWWNVPWSEWTRGGQLASA
jgi:lipoprotein-anchoring transpeptidase ErfK/SrfK